jgi:hypothetical protein
MLDKHVDELQKILQKKSLDSYLPLIGYLSQKRLLYNISEKVRGERYEGTTPQPDEPCKT